MDELRETAEDIYEDICDRSGVKHDFQDFKYNDKEVYEEIIGAWVKILEAHTTKPSLPPQKDLDPEISDLINDNLFELIEGEPPLPPSGGDEELQTLRRKIENLTVNADAVMGLIQARDAQKAAELRAGMPKIVYTSDQQIIIRQMHQTIDKVYGKQAGDGEGT